eukprot:CAMPEP_0170488096 /NCGR_PEP_ID=MMETSP0208-20121228/6715_1 /TAXON_ID=197538 /ORGANISM="Strombidium inclinatum, Strain S3" /LENGTH=320 /DNA_ID=CAMNT_0010762539 /DNA_START=466 /DNA_END=1424 /DNA_ORIENTATION=+
MAVEFYYNSIYSRPGLRRWVLLVALLFDLMPWILRLLKGKTLFASVEQALVECLIFLPKLYVMWVASLFMVFLNSFYQQKRHFKKLFMGMADCHFQQIYRLNYYLPHITPFCPVNLDSLFDLFQVLQEMDAKYIYRAQIYTLFLMMVFSIQALYIYLHLMLETKQISDFGEDYVTNSVTIFIFSFLFSGSSFIYAAEANNIDVDLKKKLMSISQEVNRIYILASMGRVYRSADQKNILIEKNNSHCSACVTMEDPSVDKGENISRKVVESCEILEETLDKKIQLMDYMLVHEKLQLFLGPTLTYDFVFQGAIVFFSVVFT